MMWSTYLMKHISIEGNPFIIRFKTCLNTFFLTTEPSGIEGNPFIIRFKTIRPVESDIKSNLSIEGNPFIIRFKTLGIDLGIDNLCTCVLKVIHL